VQQLLARAALEFPDRVAYRGLGDVQAPGGFGEVKRLGRRKEGAQLVQVKAHAGLRPELFPDITLILLMLYMNIMKYINEFPFCSIFKTLD
jgi:hypothetical protein